MTKVPKADYDSPWKEALSLHFESFLEFFFPRIWADIDWTQGYQMLDKELQKVVPGSAVGQLEADALVQVTRPSGVLELTLDGRVLLTLGGRRQEQKSTDLGRCFSARRCCR